jgi:hypothetical protein
MKIIVFMDAQGLIVAQTAQGDLLEECFFKAADETDEEIRALGYRRLVQTYPAAQIEAGAGIESHEIRELFLEC